MANKEQVTNLSCLPSLLKEVPAYRQLVGELSAVVGEPRQVGAMILDTAKPYLIAALYEELNLSIMVVTSQPEGARKLYEQLRVWCSPLAELQRLPELDFLPYDGSQLSAVSYQRIERLRALGALAFYEPQHPASSFAPLTATRPPLIVTSVLAIMSKTIPRQDFLAACHILKPGLVAEPLAHMRRWEGMGYEREDVVEVPGQMSRRGGIIDVFPPSSQMPVRIEFFGNRVESMRCFEPESQRSSNSISWLIITPAKEFVVPSSDFTLTLNLDGCTAEARQRFQEDLAKLLDGQSFPRAEFYFPLLNTGSIFDYLARGTLLVLDDLKGIELAATRLNKETEELRAAKVQSGELPDNLPSPYLTWKELETRIKQRYRLVLLDPVSCHLSATSYGKELPFIKGQSYGTQLERFLRTARQMVEEKQRVVVVSHQANRLAELLQKEDIYTSPSSGIEQLPPPGSITVVQGSLEGGWTLDSKLTLVTDVELFGFVKQPRPSTQRLLSIVGKKRPIPHQWFLTQLVPGDYVVHVDHGIARFHGLTRMTSDGVEREYLVLEYAAGDRLYVPTERIERVSRYIGGSDHVPALSRLRTPEWQRTKKKVKEAVAEIVQELLELYAAREITPGFAFSTDSLWQHELEASFPYMETPDQIEAIAAVKEDMERAKPMDRLICGDVGYGKTEIALRAAFKAVMDNKQVAILVPTTVLAQQHFLTFTERLQTFPLRVEMLSRFCPPEKEREVLHGLANGTVDICIGTHRLLQKDVTFKDLGLVIVDEEQQFGVVQKEKLRQMRKEVDTLALSATPIPRTLYMSLSGIRDMSIVGTPPEERLAIQTYVGAYDEMLVRRVILRELERNGQVFFVHNRVQSIAWVAHKLEDLVPEARIAIAHGQMPEEELEKVMTDFIAGRYDILVTTTIIQLGLDMPNVNTLIVDRADKLGLAQLHQLRGRVGRGINQAYAYFFFDDEDRLTPQACKRLRTICEASQLGSGFAIAMKDLEIRGAGNLLGVKQSGHIAAVGFDLYCQLLAEAVEELKAASSNLSLEEKEVGKGTKSIVVREVHPAPTISLPLPAHIPEEYVSNLNIRLSLYQRLARVEHIEEVEDIAQEFEDRFGPLPQPVRNLLYVVKIKALAMKAKVSSISAQGRQIVIKPRADSCRLTSIGSVHGGVKVGPTQIRLDMRLLGDRWKEVLEEILECSG